MFQYHYVFLIVSISIAGLSVGAALATLMMRDKNNSDWGDLSHAAVLLALLLIGTTVVLSQLRSANLVGVALMAAALPFVGIGFLNAALFSTFAQFSGILYAADLIGGACGLVVALAVIGWIGAFNTIIALGILCGGAAFILSWIGGKRTLQNRILGVSALLIVLLLVNQIAGLIEFSPVALENAPPDKTMLRVLHDPEAVLMETRWDPFARVDMVAISDNSVRYVFTDAGAGSIMIRYNGDERDVAWLQREIAYLPFTLNPDTTLKVLILGAGAGKDVLMAHLAGAESITAVEINPTIVDLTRASADYNGDIFDLPGVETIISDGRNFIERSDNLYDLIYANIVYSQAAAPGHSALSESYIFTREALQAYWNHLSENGQIAFVTHHGIEGLRMLVAALDMLQQEGFTLQQALQHVAFASLRQGDPQTRTSVVMVTRQPWIQDAASEFAESAHQRGAGFLYLPTYQELGMEGLVQGALTLDDYIAANTDYDYTPTTDDSPFFYQFNPGLPNGLAELLLISLLLTLAYLSWLIFFSRRDKAQRRRTSLGAYFALLGAAFLLIEIPLIQQFNLLLGQPALALVAVIGALLIGSGLGSLFSNRFEVDKLPRLVTLFALAVGLVVLLSLAVYPAVIRWALPFDLAARLIVTAMALLPPGFLMGVCFPSGLRVAHQTDSQGVAAFWGANAVTSVLGSALAMIIAVSIGFSAALVLGAVFYGLATVLVYFTWRNMLMY